MYIYDFASLYGYIYNTKQNIILPMIKNFNQYIHENYVGTMAQSTIKRDRKFKTALEMEKRKYSNEEIRMSTGWFRNPHDNEWRYEHDTRQIKFKKLYLKDLGDKFQDTSQNNLYRTTLGNLIENTTLFKEYPSLADIGVNMFDQFSGNKREGSYNPQDEDITIYRVHNLSHDYKACKKSIEVYTKHLTPEYLETQPATTRNGSPFDKDAYVERTKQNIKDAKEELAMYSKVPFFIFEEEHKSVLLHELQHAIQYLEGFAKGGSPSSFQDGTHRQAVTKVSRPLLHKKYRELGALYNKIQKGMDDAGLDGLPDLYIDGSEYQGIPEVDAYRAMEKEVANKEYADKDNETKLTKFDQYQHLAGEIEARDVQNRMKYGKEAGWGIYDSRYQDVNNLFAGLLLSFNTKEEAEKFLKKHTDDKDIVTIKESRYKKEWIAIEQFKSRKTVKPLDSVDYDAKKVIVRK
jgi:hypothetical protein